MSLLFLKYHKSSATEGIPAVPPTCLEGQPLEMSSPPKGNFQEKYILRAELPLLIICNFYIEKKCPGMERASSKTATNKMLGFIIPTYCIFMKQRPNPSGVVTVRQACFLLISSLF